MPNIVIFCCQLLEFLVFLEICISYFWNRVKFSGNSLILLMLVLNFVKQYQCSLQYRNSLVSLLRQHCSESSWFCPMTCKVYHSLAGGSEQYSWLFVSSGNYFICLFQCFFPRPWVTSSYT